MNFPLKNKQTKNQATTTKQQQENIKDVFNLVCLVGRCWAVSPCLNSKDLSLRSGSEMFASFTASPALLVCVGSAVMQGAPRVLREPQGALHSWNATAQHGKVVWGMGTGQSCRAVQVWSQDRTCRVPCSFCSVLPQIFPSLSRNVTALCTQIKSTQAGCFLLLLSSELQAWATVIIWCFQIN